MTSAPSLRLELHPSGTAVVLIAADGFEQDLRLLVAGFLTVVHLGPGSVQIALDDLLANLKVMGRWPNRDVEWDDQLKSVVADSVRDAKAVAAQLKAEPTSAPALNDEEVSEQLGSGWIGPLAPFQRRDIGKLLALSHGANFSVPGAGKTRVALATFQALREQGHVQRLLVVGPKSAYESWLGENETCFAEPLRAQVLKGQIDVSAELLIVNYERLDRSQVALARWLAAGPSMIILDEAHRMKLGADGVYGAACLALGPLARRRLILTGTPAPNGVKDLENLFSFVWPGQGRQEVRRAVGSGDLKQASIALQPLFTRTTKAELNLPHVRARARVLDFPKHHQEIYSALIGQMREDAARSDGDLEALGRIIMYLLMAATSPALLKKGGSKYEPLQYHVPALQPPPGSPLAKLLEDLPNYELSPKYAETVKIVAANAAVGRKTLVWSTFIRSLNTLEGMLKPHRPAMVRGGTLDRDDQLRRFREDPDCMVLLSNPATLGEGISLHHVCHDAVYVDRDFAAGRYLQSLDRIHRLGLAADTITNITVLITANTIDELVDRRLEDKLTFLGRILDDPAVVELGDLEEEAALSPGLSASDISALLSHLNSEVR
ncbi:DEAD/DEAH box helicase [Catenulispora pinisilvae]|uniref:DEAD/DEAH box helicase n=1 Tax=Catenulispora pinisilvae TaxID=2705253 RepID=UPI002B2777A1|nr:DEAD/DEAH box helicase [Catenulispora pinisilvae]